MNPDLDWTAGGPRSLRYGDVYFSNMDGLAESRAVFLQGCGLPEAWAGRERFVVAELGFGTGLNIAALLHLWKRTGPPGAHLSMFSVEAHPLTCADAARVLSAWPELAESAGALLSCWPQARAGFHRLSLDDHAATLDLYMGDVGEALARWSGSADAWFLDGFAPSRNPEMWSEEVLSAVARLSAPGARVASFTVAGHVRRSLAAAGFKVAKRPGYGAKAERLEARLDGAEPPSRRQRLPSRHVAILGAGIAGAALVRAFSRQGVACTVIEAVSEGAGASGNPAALVTPRLDAGFGPAAELHAQTFAEAVNTYRREIPQAIIGDGALQLSGASNAQDRFRRLASWNGFRDSGLRALDAAEAFTRLGEAAAEASAALLIADAVVLEPATVLRQWLSTAPRIAHHVAALQPSSGGWSCLDAEGQVLVEAEVVCLAAGFGIAALAPGTALRPVRGQVEFTLAPVFEGQAAAWGPYAIPLRGGGVLFGASHKRDDANHNLRPAETVANLEALSERLPALAGRVRAVAPDALRARAAVRAATSDHLPLAGAWGDQGLYVLGGLGGRGFTLAPLLAEHIVSNVLGAPSPISTDLAARVHPCRFTMQNPQVAAPLSPTDLARSEHGR